MNPRTAKAIAGVPLWWVYAYPLRGKPGSALFTAHETAAAAVAHVERLTKTLGDKVNVGMSTQRRTLEACHRYAYHRFEWPSFKSSGAVANYTGRKRKRLQAQGHKNALDRKR